MRLALVAVLVIASAAAAEPPRRVPFWPDAVPATIQARIDGPAILAAVRALAQHHRVQGSPGYRAAADWVVAELKQAGLADAAIESLPADGKTRYAHFRSTLGWTAGEGRLEEPARKAVLADTAQSRVALADYSQDADVTADLVDAGAGTAPAHYEGKDIKGKLVLASGALPTVHEQAVIARGAAGLVSDFPNQQNAWHGRDPDQVRWGHLDAYDTRNRFAFMVSKRQANELRARLARGERITLRAHVRAKMVPASYDIVSATIAGSDPAAGEIVLTAHLCHQSPGANDNASGSAALLGVARALAAAVAAGQLAAPRRTLRFLWLPEITGSQAWLITHPEIARRLRAGVHLDMVGGRPEVTHAVLHVSRTAPSLPHVANEIMRAFTDEVARATSRHAETGKDPRAGFVWPEGSPEPLVPDVRGLDLGSDHEVFEEASFAVPMVYFHDWPDSTIHTAKDVPDNLDATKLGRVAYMAAGIAYTLAALPDDEAAKLVPLTRAGIDEALALARRAAVGGAPDAALVEREIVRTGEATLASVASLWPGTARVVSAERNKLRRQFGSPAKLAPQDRRIAHRAPDVRGPLAVYYYDRIEEALGEVPKDALVERSEVLAYEALNFVDDKRNVSEIRDVLAGRIGPVSLDEVARWLELLVAAKVLSW